MATNATIEKVVRKVLDDELSESKEATLKAIQQVRRLLTEQVIPNLPDEGDQADDEPADETPAAGKFGSRAMSGRASRHGSDAGDNPEIPEDGEDDPPTSEIPATVTEAFDEVYSSLSAEQAKVLAAFFTAISEEPSSGADQQEEA